MYFLCEIDNQVFISVSGLRYINCHVSEFYRDHDTPSFEEWHQYLNTDKTEMSVVYYFNINPILKTWKRIMVSQYETLSQMNNDNITNRFVMIK